MSTPLQIISDHIAASCRREEVAIEPDSDIWVELKEYLVTQKMWVYADLVRAYSAKLKHTESETPLYRDALALAVAALEEIRQEIGFPRCRAKDALQQIAGKMSGHAR